MPWSLLSTVDTSHYTDKLAATVIYCLVSRRTGRAEINQGGVVLRGLCGSSSNPANMNTNTQIRGKEIIQYKNDMSELITTSKS